MPTEIRMEREMCFGICPAYHVTLRSDGYLIYEGLAYVKHVGTWKAKVAQRRFRNLARLADRVQFATLKTNPLVTFDVQQTTVIAKFQVNEHSVHENGDGPDGLHALERRIDSVIRSAHDWRRLKPPESGWLIKGDTDTAPRRPG